jgi:molecular chaperone GrpE
MSKKDANNDSVAPAKQAEGNEDTVEMEVSKQDFAELEQRLGEAETRAQENWDKAVRAQAELENVRRRAERDLENAHKYALEKFFLELLPVKDSLEMGLEAARGNNADLAKLIEGTELTHKMLEDLMIKFGICDVHPLDEQFNPELHQAMSLLESPDKAPNTVVAVMQKGYTLNDRLIRPAMVVVSKQAENSASDGGEKA